jgi:hypothetical protein
VFADNELYESFEINHGKPPTIKNIMRHLLPNNADRKKKRNWAQLQTHITQPYLSAREATDKLGFSQISSSCKALEALIDSDDTTVLYPVAKILAAAKAASEGFELVLKLTLGTPNEDVMALHVRGMRSWTSKLEGILQLRMQSLMRYLLLALFSDECTPMLQDRSSDDIPPFSASDCVFGHGGLLFGLLTPLAPVQLLFRARFQTKKQNLQRTVIDSKKRLKEAVSKLATVRGKLLKELGRALETIEALAEDSSDSVPAEDTARLQNLSEALHNAVFGFYWIRAKQLEPVMLHAQAEVAQNPHPKIPLLLTPVKGEILGGEPAPSQAAWVPSSKLADTLTALVSHETQMARESNQLEAAEKELGLLLCSKEAEAKPVEYVTASESFCSFVMRLLYWASAVYAMYVFVERPDRYGPDPELAKLKGFQPFILLCCNAIIGAGYAGYRSRISANQRGSKRVQNQLRSRTIVCPYDKACKNALSVLQSLEHFHEHEMGARVQNLGPLRLILGGRQQCTLAQAIGVVVLSLVQCVGPMLLVAESTDYSASFDLEVLNVINFFQMLAFGFQCFGSLNAITSISSKARCFGALADVDTADKFAALPFMDILSDLSTLDAWYEIRKYIKEMSSEMEKTICQLTIAVVFIADLAFAGTLLFLVFNPSSDVNPEDLVGGFSVLQVSH